MGYYPLSNFIKQTEEVSYDFFVFQSRGNVANVGFRSSIKTPVKTE